MISPRPSPRKPQPDKPDPRLIPIERTEAMTICIAAICNGNMDSLWYPHGDPQFIVGISDRMVSTNRTQSELPQPKFRNTVNAVTVLMSGINDVTSNIFDRTNSYIWEDFTGNERLIPVKEIADRYSRNLITFLKERREQISQARIGLTFETFLNKYDELPQTLREEILYEINDERGEETGTQTIISGIDEGGAHIYLIDARGVVSCQDSIGFAVIGSGSLHAQSQLMQTRHSPDASYYETLFLTYMAKKQAELDPWVGKDTDIFVIKDDTNRDILPPEIVKAFGEIYENTYNQMFTEAKTKIMKLFS